MSPPARPRRLPANYQLVHEVVKLQVPGHHAPAGDIFARAKALKPSLGYSTVYRALGRLCALGLILEVHVPGMNGALYEPARPGHAHFVCRICGALHDIDCDLPDKAVATALAALGGRIEEVSLTVHGRCAACCAAEDQGETMARASRPAR